MAPATGSGAPALARILMRSFVLVTAVAVLVFGLPLAVLVARSYRQDAAAQLVREATRVVSLGDFDADPPKLPAAGPQFSVGIYTPAGKLLTGDGPATEPGSRTELGDGVTRVGAQGNQLVAYVPFHPDDHDPLTVRVAAPRSGTTTRIWLSWLAIAALMVAAMLVAAVVAARRTTTLARPFERLAAAAGELSNGEPTVVVEPTGVREGDQVARALEAAGRDAAHQLAAAQQLAQDASHQVRTPIAAARLALEAALVTPDPTGEGLRAAATAAVTQLERAATALAEVIELRRGTPQADQPTVPADAALAAAIARWTPIAAVTQRRIVPSISDLDGLAVPAAPLRQALDVLLDNALKHGSGTIAVRARAAGAWVLIDIADEGSIHATSRGDDIFTRGVGAGSGIGLAVARDLAQGVRGRLVLAEREPTSFQLVLPASCDPAVSDPATSDPAIPDR